MIIGKFDDARGFTRFLASMGAAILVVWDSIQFIDDFDLGFGTLAFGGRVASWCACACACAPDCHSDCLLACLRRVPSCPAEGRTGIIDPAPGIRH